MTKIGKKEQLILNRIARKKLSNVEDLKDIQTAKQEIKDIDHNGGRPAIYSTTEQLETVIGEYFIEVETKKQHPTITGLSLKLGIDRQTLLDYNKKDMFTGAIKKAKQMILAYTENMLVDKATFTPGQIFYLKNNYKQDYQDKIEIDNKHSGSISLVELSRLASTISDGDIVEGELLEESALPEET